MVLARDQEGNECRARVSRIEGDLVFLELDYDTWIDGCDPGSPIVALTSAHALTKKRDYRLRRRSLRRRRRSHTGSAQQLVRVA